jgi:hypothetical protein
MSEVELTEQVLTAINLGRTADLVFRHIKDVLDVQTNQTLVKMKSDFRAGKIDQVAIQCRLAELCVLEDLENRLKQQIAQGERAILRTHGKGD